jgi:hypothetical protein
MASGVYLARVPVSARKLAHPAQSVNDMVKGKCPSSAIGGKGHCNDESPAFGSVLRLDRSVVQLRNALRDGQSESGSSIVMFP